MHHQKGYYYYITKKVEGLVALVRLFRYFCNEPFNGIVMGYVEKNLLKGEEIKYTASIHWAAFLPGIFWTIIAIIATASFTGEWTIVTILLWLFAAFRFIKGFFLKLFSECVLTTTRIIYKYGWISRQTVELQLTKCEGVSVEQGVIGRMLNFGTVIVTTGGPTNRFSIIADPITFRNYINEQIDIVHSSHTEKKSSADKPTATETKQTNQQKKSTAEEIKELSDLLKQGLITEDEFKTMKSKVINRE